jgi:ACS family allantoate permease-like MFS transporter
MTGSQIFKTKDAPRYVPGTIGCVICLGAEFALVVSWRCYYMWMNKKRERMANESGVPKEEQERMGREMGERDVTDLQNPWFRYTM